MAQAPGNVRSAPQAHKEFAVLTTGRIAVAAGATVTPTIQVPVEANFELLAITGWADVAAAAQNYSTRIDPNITLVISDTASGRQLMNLPVPWGGMVGTQEFPFKLPTPRIFVGGALIQITLVSFEAANANNVFLNLIGNKIYKV
jgi:hypothetical protein